MDATNDSIQLLQVSEIAECCDVVHQQTSLCRSLPVVVFFQALPTRLIEFGKMVKGAPFPFFGKGKLPRLYS